MTDENVDDIPQESELDALKARAETMGLKFHPSSGVDSLKDKIAKALAGDKEKAPVVASKPLSAKQKDVLLKKQMSEQVRIRVACMNPAKREWEGEIFTTGNAVVGTIKKMVPFDTEWHVPRMILNMIQAKECQTFYTETDKRTGNKTRKGRIVKEFAVEILPALTAKELQELAQRQAMANGTSK
jgi:hypothetical protein|tara:strand:+ start:9464 stop:10018 length:555 start_codon:yes stop_codon:yes gene_type:complete